jgi:hypothetical protein
LHHRRFGILPARSAQDINARVGKNLPEAGLQLNAKVKLSCEEIVIVAALLWKRLEIGVEIGGDGLKCLSAA